MAVEFETVTHAIEQSYPLECAYDWDNSGAVLKAGRSISRILIAVDLTSSVLCEAERLGCELVFVHHPPIFHEIKRLSIDDPVTSLVLRAAAKGISLYASHTSADCAPAGLNFALADKLGLSNSRIFIPGEHRPGGLGVVGELGEALDENGLCERIKNRLGVPAVRRSAVSGSFERLAVVGGSAGECWADARAQGVGALLVGEAKHNHFVEAEEAGILLIAAGHYETERVFVKNAVGVLGELKAAHPEIEIYETVGGASSVIC